MESQNPYRAPAEQSDAKVADSGRRYSWFGWFEIGVACALVLVLLAAVAHRCQFHDAEAYRSSPLIAIEIVGVLTTLALIPVSAVRFLYCVIVGRPSAAIMAVFLGLFSIAAFVASLLIDAPTLIYMT